MSTSSKQFRYGIGNAFGKIILFGEHSVVYGKPAIAIPVKNLSTTIKITENNKKNVTIYSPLLENDVKLESLTEKDPIRRTIDFFFDTTKVAPKNGFNISIESSIPIASGLGSGAAVSVALVRGLANYFNITLPLETINAIAFEIEKLHHGTPSGIDNTTITFEQPIFFQKKQPIEFLEIRNNYNFIVANSGIQASTKEVVAGVRNRFDQETNHFQQLFNEMGFLCKKAKSALMNGNKHLVGELMNENHQYLQKIGVSSNKLDQLVLSAQKAGALGAKLSGAGIGGNVIALVLKEDQYAVMKEFKLAGAEHVFSTCL